MGPHWLEKPGDPALIRGWRFGLIDNNNLNWTFGGLET
jgi:hypothetical protein